MNFLLRTYHLERSYGHHKAVDQVSLTVYPNEVVAIIGPNGAGKSTLIELILGLRQADGGTVEFGTPTLRRQLGVQLQTTPFFPGLSSLDNLKLVAAFYGVKLGTSQAQTILEQCRLTDVTHTDAARLSGGQQKRLSVALALVNNPRLVFLDEPTAALDPRAALEIRGLIGQLAQQGCAVVFTSHDMNEVAHLADRVMLIVDGQIKASGTPDELLSSHDVSSLENLYLTLTHALH